MAQVPIHIGAPKSWQAVVNNSTTVTDVATGASGGTRIEHWWIYNDHTSAATVNAIINDGTNDRIVYQVSLASKGTLNVLAALSGSAEKQYLVLQSGHKIRFQTPSTVANNVTAIADGGDF